MSYFDEVAPTWDNGKSLESLSKPSMDFLVTIAKSAIQRWEKAAQGPWSLELQRLGPVVYNADGDEVAYVSTAPDAEFIAGAWQDVYVLATMAIDYLAELEKWRAIGDGALRAADVSNKENEKTRKAFARIFNLYAGGNQLTFEGLKAVAASVGIETELPKQDDKPVFPNLHEGQE